LGKCFQKNPADVNCTEVWEKFSAAAAMANNVVNDTDYLPFFSVANFATARDNILFWSGNQAFALMIANDGTRYTTIEETSTGFVMNGMNWCGVYGANPPRFDYNTPCVYPSNSTYYGTQGVWAQSSKRFAQGASGLITILLQPGRLNYNDGPYMAYRNTSVFYQVELPNIDKNQVTGVQVLLIVNLTQAPDEKCGSGSLVALAHDLKEKFGFAPNCTDNPLDIYELLCPDGATATAECLAATLAYNQYDPEAGAKERLYLIWALTASVVCAAMLVLVVYFAIRARRAGQYAEIKG